jgi:hypothetical protein
MRPAVARGESEAGPFCWLEDDAVQVQQMSGVRANETNGGG